FVVLFLGTATLEIDHLLPPHLEFLHGTSYRGHPAVPGLASLVFLGGPALAFLPGYVGPSGRVRSRPEPEAALVLTPLAAIGIAGLATEAARITVDGRPDFEVWSFVGYPLSALVPAATAHTWHQAFWVVHVLTFAAFLAVLPMTK